MKYNVSLGLLATEAMSELTRAEGSNSEDHYRLFLEKTAEVCRAVRRSYEELHVDTATLPPLTVNFLSAVMASQPQVITRTNATKLEIVNSVEPVVIAIMKQRRAPTSDERFRIAEALYQTSAADRD